VAKSAKVEPTRARAGEVSAGGAEGVVEVEPVDQEGGPIHSGAPVGHKEKPPDRNPEGASEFFRTQLASILLL
jgi:hypothetical protein